MENWDFGVISVLLRDAAASFERVIAAMPQARDSITIFFETLTQQGFALQHTVMMTLVFLVIAVTAELSVRRLLSPLVAATPPDRAEELPQNVPARLLVETVALITFAIFMFAPLVLILGTDPVAMVSLATYGPALISIRVLEAAARVLISPGAAVPEARWLALDASQARRLYLSCVVIASLAALLHYTMKLFEQGGFQSEVLMGLLLSSRTVVAGSVIAAFLFNKDGIAQIFTTRRDGLSRGPRWRALAKVWHYLASFYVLLSWLWTNVLILVNTSGASDAAVQSFLVIALAVIMGLLLDSWAHRGALDETSQISVLQEVGARAGVQAIVAVTGVLLLYIWMPTWDNIPFLKGDLSFRGAFLQIVVALFFSYFLWQLFSVYTTRVAGSDENGDANASRIVTLFPLVRTTIFLFLLCVTTIIVLAAMGVDFLPLLAGASIFGLALGLGSQALVKDVISGLFFFFDDAFRVGEYVDLGLATGTVEQVSIRSVRIRHHFGTLNTIPYGEIKTVANLSRDWAIYPIEFRVGFHADPEELRAIVEDLGEQLQNDPEHGPLFVDPLTFQGVIAMEDETLMVRCYYKTKPGDQWALRPTVFNALREALADAGINVVAREVRFSSPGSGGHLAPQVVNPVASLPDE